MRLLKYFWHGVFIIGGLFFPIRAYSLPEVCGGAGSSGSQAGEGQRAENLLSQGIDPALASRCSGGASGPAAAFCSRANVKASLADADDLKSQMQGAISQAHGLSQKALGKSDSASVQKVQDSAAQLKDGIGSLDRFKSGQTKELEKADQTLEKQAEKGIYGMVYDGGETVNIRKISDTESELSITQGEPTPPVGTLRKVSETEWEHSIEAGGIIGENTAVETKEAGVGMVLWNGADAKVAPKSEVVIKGCKPGQTCEQQLNSGKVYQNTYHFPKPEPKVEKEGDKGAIRTPAPVSSEGEKKAGGKKKNKMALIAGALALGFFTAEVVTNVNKKGEATTVVLRGQVEATCGDSKEKILLKPGQMLKASADGACEEPQKIDLKKINRFWYKIK